MSLPPRSDGRYPGRPDHHTTPSSRAPQATFEIRTTRRFAWFSAALKAFPVSLILGIAGAVLAILVLEAALPPDVLVPVGLAAGAACAVFFHLGLMIATVPRYWAKQGVRVDGDGIQLYRERKWWLDGTSARVGWDDIHHIDSSSTQSSFDLTRKNRVSVVEIHLHRTDQGLRLPAWGRLLAEGERRWGVTAAHRSALVLNMNGIGHRYSLLEHLRRTVPDLCRDRAVEPAARAQEALQAQGVRQRREDGQGQGARPQPAHPRDHGRDHRTGRPTRAAHPARTTTAWISLRLNRIGVWAIGAAMLLGSWVLIVLGVRVALTGHVPFAVTVFFLALVTVPLSFWSLRSLPRCLVRQGIEVDGSGITLVQEPFLWCARRTAHLPWTEVRVVREEKVSGNSRLVHVFMHHPDALSTAPTWCFLSNRADHKAPASTTDPLTLIVVRAPDRSLIQFSKAAHAARPDLVVRA
ncbi:hypothetical protein [Nocardiopsis nanhaiensis]